MRTVRATFNSTTPVIVGSPRSSPKDQGACQPGRGLQPSPALGSSRLFVAPARSAAALKAKALSRAGVVRCPVPWPWESSAPARPARSHGPALRARPSAWRGRAPTPFLLLPRPPRVPRALHRAPRASFQPWSASSPAWEPARASQGWAAGSTRKVSQEGEEEDELRPRTQGEGRRLCGAATAYSGAAQISGCVVGSAAAPGHAS